jgi:cell shape-determining protein MreC
MKNLNMKRASSITDYIIIALIVIFAYFYAKESGNILAAVQDTMNFILSIFNAFASVVYQIIQTFSH